MEAVWVKSSADLPCGARRALPEGVAQPDKAWLDVCVLGHHIPQMYRDSEIYPLTAEDCPRLGLCPDCLGYGDLWEPGRDASIREVVRGPDQLRQPCTRCEGSGRPALKVNIERDASGLTGSLSHRVHNFTPWPDAGPGWCIACAVQQPENREYCLL